MFETARQLKRDVYGNRIVLFAPLYVGNLCINDCSYCGFRRSNPDAQRRTLSRGELVEQVQRLEDTGHKRLILVFGEHPQLRRAVHRRDGAAVYDVKGHGEIRRVNINAAPLDHEGYRDRSRLPASAPTRSSRRPTTTRPITGSTRKNTIKGDYEWRLDALSRAWEVGLDDVGIGALFGLYDWRFDTLRSCATRKYLMERFDCGPHTISFPRMQAASGIDMGDPSTWSPTRLQAPGRRSCG
jgi:2-iminoacetate synthase